MSNFKNPTPEQQMAFAKLEHQGPIVMMNLIKYKAGDAKPYFAYLAAVSPLVEQIGTKVLYAGKPLITLIGEDSGAEWDLVLLVSYPQKEALMALSAHPEYPGHLREAAIEDSRLVALADQPLGHSE